MKGYIHTGTPLTALDIFDKIPAPDAISYLIAIQACAQIAMLRRARTLYQRISCDFPLYTNDSRIMNALIDMFGKVSKKQLVIPYIDPKIIRSFLLVC
jgi:hypothetical protein